MLSFHKVVKYRNVASAFGIYKNVLFIEVCPQFKDVLIERFHCTLNSNGIYTEVNKWYWFYQQTGIIQINCSMYGNGCLQIIN